MQKKCFGDRWDRILLRDMDSMHVIMPHLMPNRADNEAYLRIKVDMTNLNAYLAKKNVGLDHADRYTAFHAVVMAAIKTVALRPKMKRFIQGRHYYEHRAISTTFVVKKQFKDEAHESIALINFDENTTFQSFHERVLQEIHSCRRGNDAKDSTEGAMDILKKLPRPLLRFAFFCLRCLDYFGIVPRSLVRSDPNYACIFLTNLGSIGMDAAYHHLNNWGTNSLFITIGRIHDESTLQSDGTVLTRSVLDIGVTLDERIADGYYYAKSLQLLQKLLENPEYLETPAKEEVDL